ncbi:hypothetical protein [Nocardia camponoti]|nr:hypothetical protein [Nocardia camponoti]
MRDWTLSKIVWVTDRGFSSAENRRYLRQRDHQYVIGEKMRSGSEEADGHPDHDLRQGHLGSPSTSRKPRTRRASRCRRIRARQWQFRRRHPHRRDRVVTLVAGDGSSAAVSK